MMPLAYLLKFMAISAILFLFYKLVLEGEHVHHFKRAYLIGALLAALFIPAIVFTEYTAIDPISKPLPLFASLPTNAIPGTPLDKMAEPDLRLHPFLWGVYFLGAFIFGLRFFRNLFQLVARIKRSPAQRWKQFVHVLIKEPLPPHTFLKYIFLNQQKYEANEIHEAVVLHEQAHAEQRHSYDILFVEVLQVVFWMNPFIYFIKKAIRLNHEFLADAAVLQNPIPTKTYQNILLSHLAKDHNLPQTPHFSNAIHLSSYSSIKKRFTLMKRKPSKKTALLRSILVLPLMGLLLLGFSKTEVVALNSTVVPKGAPTQTASMVPQRSVSQQTKGTQTKREHTILFAAQEIVKEIVVRIDPNGQLYLQNAIVPINALEESLANINPHLSVQERAKLVRSVIFAPTGTSQKLIDKIDAALTAYGVATVNVVGPKNEVKITGRGATPKELREYDRLARHYNTMPRNKMKIVREDVKRLGHIYAKMTLEQKARAQPFPNFPEPPKAPAPPKPSEVPRPPKAPTPAQTELQIIKETGRMPGNVQQAIEKEAQAFRQEALALKAEAEKFKVETELFKQEMKALEKEAEKFEAESQAFKQEMRIMEKEAEQFKAASGTLEQEMEALKKEAAKLRTEAKALKKLLKDKDSIDQR
ncbi:M56 family metallopeptidase [Maribacter sp. 2307ULW6-5]|uniref:M56 family metallopeptidase n=1 Tax=Maribacter sp. 2307ULW6-5 TaxID=3386275 RepID=UPI0039BD1973